MNEIVNKFLLQTGDTNYIYRHDLDKAYFQYDMAYGKYKDLTKRTQSDKVLRNKVIQSMMDIIEDYLQWFISFLIKRLLVEKLNLCQINNLLKNFMNQLLESLKKEKIIPF